MEKKNLSPEEIEALEDEMDRIAYEKAMAEYRANPVTYTMEEVRAKLGEAKAYHSLLGEVEKGWKSAEEKGWIDIDEAETLLSKEKTNE